MVRRIDSKVATTAVKWSAATAGALATATELMLNAAPAEQRRRAMIDNRSVI